MTEDAYEYPESVVRKWVRDAHVFQTALHLSAVSNSLIKRFWPMNDDKMQTLNPVERANLAYAVAEYLDEVVGSYEEVWKRLAK